MANRFVNPVPQFVDQNGDPLVGGTLTFYYPITSSFKDTYSDEAGTIPNVNPITLNDRGASPVELWLVDMYRVVLKNATGTVQWDRDPVSGLGSSTGPTGASVDTVADLRLFDSGTQGDITTTLGYWAIGDGGGSTYYWDSTSTADDNGGSVIQATGMVTGRWLWLNPTESFYAAQFGLLADGDGLGNGTDNLAVILNMQKYVATKSRATVIFPEEGVIGFSDQTFWTHCGYLTLKFNKCKLQNITTTPAKYGYNMWFGVDYFTNRAPGLPGFTGTVQLPFLLNTVAIGSHTVTLSSVAAAAYFTAGTRALILGYDQQGFGYPPNPRYFEEVYIQSINTGTGVLTLDRPTENAYNSAWYPADYSGGTWVSGSGYNTTVFGPASIVPLDRTLRYGQKYLEIDYLCFIPNINDPIYATYNGDSEYSSESPYIQGWDVVRLGTVKVGQFAVGQCNDVLINNLTCVDLQGDKIVDRFEVKAGLITKCSDGTGLTHAKFGRGVVIKWNSSFVGANVEYQGTTFNNPNNASGNRPVGSAFFVSADSFKMEGCQFLWDEANAVMQGPTFNEDVTNPDQPGNYTVTAIAPVTSTTFTVAFGDGTSRIRARKGTVMTRPSDGAQIVIEDITYNGTNFVFTYSSDATISAAEKLWYYPILSMYFGANNIRRGKTRRYPWIDGKVTAQQYTNTDDGYTRNTVDTVIRDVVINSVTTNFYLDAYIEEIEVNIEKIYTGAGSGVLQWFTVAPNGTVSGGIVNTKVAGRRILTPAAALNAQAGDTLVALGYNTYIMAYGFQVLAADNKGNLGYQGYVRISGSRR